MKAKLAFDAGELCIVERAHGLDTQRRRREAPIGRQLEVGDGVFAGAKPLASCVALCAA